eukprot:4857564-Lingulodinium_polyedra.AAC.1
MKLCRPMARRSGPSCPSSDRANRRALQGCTGSAVNATAQGGLRPSDCGANVLSNATWQPKRE